MTVGGVPADRIGVERVRWGVDLELAPPGGFAQADALVALLDLPELAAVTQSDRVVELTFREEVTAAAATEVADVLALLAALAGPPVLVRYPVGPLQVSCAAFTPRYLMHKALTWGVLGGRSDGTTAVFTIGADSRVDDLPIRFPPGWSAVDGPLTVLDERGRAVACVGDAIEAGGAQTGGAWSGTIWRGRGPAAPRSRGRGSGSGASAWTRAVRDRRTPSPPRGR